MRYRIAHVTAALLIAAGVVLPVGAHAHAAGSPSATWRPLLRTLSSEVVRADRRLDAGMRSRHAPGARALFRGCAAGFTHVSSALTSLPASAPARTNMLVFDLDNAAMYGQGACGDAAVGIFTIASWYRGRVDLWTRRAQREVANATRS
jgi:hypothetical protein